MIILLDIYGLFSYFKRLPDGWAWKPLVYILASNFAFGVLLGGFPSIKLPAAGIIAGIYALTLITSLASRRFNLRQVLILATVLAVGSYLAFILLLQLQIPVWPASSPVEETNPWICFQTFL